MSRHETPAHPEAKSYPGSTASAPSSFPHSSLPKCLGMVMVKDSATHLHLAAISSQMRTPSMYQSVLLPADKAFPTAENKPIKANAACCNKSDESVQADWYCLVNHPLYPSVLKLDEHAVEDQLPHTDCHPDLAPKHLHFQSDLLTAGSFYFYSVCH